MSQRDFNFEDEDEEEVIPDPNPQLIKLQELLKQKNTLTRYKDFLIQDCLRSNLVLNYLRHSH